MTARRRPGGAQQIPRPPEFSEHYETPWALGSAWTSEQLLGPVPRRSNPMLPSIPDAKLSAVLLLLADGPQGAEVLLTRRSMEMNNHKGEISFPGGRVDPGETAIEAALREAHEEVGLDPHLPTVVGELEHLNTIVSKSYIVPVVARLDVPERPRLEPQTMEADRVMWTPISELTRPATYRLEQWGDVPIPLHFFELDDETVWGATARMLFDLLTLQ